MSEIHESISVDVPFDRVPEFAERFLASITTKGGDAVIPLSVEVGDLVVEREARLAIVPTRRYWGYEIMDIGWEARGGGPYPSFEGSLTVRADEDYTGAVLELAGEYDPPLGAAGKAFDAVLGQRIAALTATEFLRTIGRQMETQYEREEEAKQAL